MVKHTQTNRRQQPNCLSMFDHFVKLAFKGVTSLFCFFKLTLISPNISDGFLIVLCLGSSMASCTKSNCSPFRSSRSQMFFKIGVL